MSAPIDYDGDRTAGQLASWINTKTGLFRSVKEPQSAVVTLTSSNFDDVVDGSKGVLVEFYAPW